MASAGTRRRSASARWTAPLEGEIGHVPNVCANGPARHTKPARTEDAERLAWGAKRPRARSDHVCPPPTPPRSSSSPAPSCRSRSVRRSATTCTSGPPDLQNRIADRDHSLLRLHAVRLPARDLVLVLDRLRRRGLSVRAADDDRLARGDLPVDVRDDQPEPRRREARRSSPTTSGRRCRRRTARTRSCSTSHTRSSKLHPRGSQLHGGGAARCPGHGWTRAPTPRRGPQPPREALPHSVKRYAFGGVPERGPIRGSKLSATGPNSEQLEPRSRQLNPRPHNQNLPAGGRAVAGSNPVSPIGVSPANQVERFAGPFRPGCSLGCSLCTTLHPTTRSFGSRLRRGGCQHPVGGRAVGGSDPNRGSRELISSGRRAVLRPGPLASLAAQRFDEALRTARS